MARKRMVDPQFFLDEQLAELSPHARLLYIGLWTLADDNSFTLPNRPKWIQAQLFPYEKVNIFKLLEELIGIGKVLVFAVDSDEFLYLKNMGKWQKIDKPSKQKYPTYLDNSWRSSVGAVEDSCLNEVKVVEVNRSKDKVVEVKAPERQRPLSAYKGKVNDAPTDVLAMRQNVAKLSNLVKSVIKPIPR